MKKRFAAAMLLLAACDIQSDPEAALSTDLAAITALHEADVAAVLAEDVDALLNLWSEEPVALPPDGAILAGREAIAGMLEPIRSNVGGPWQTVEYTQDFTEVEVIGEYAWDLGTVRRRLVHTSGTEVILNGKLLRILRRQTDGSWRVHRSAWNSEPPVTSETGNDDSG